MRALVAALLLLPMAYAQTAHVGNAVRLMQDRHFAEASVEFELALAAEPNNDTLRIQYATCLFAEERNDEARRQFEIEQKRLGEKPGITYYLGILDLRAGQFPAAIQKLKPGETNPIFPKASYYLGMAYLGTGQTTAAITSLERAAKLNPHDAEVHYRLARVYSAAGRTNEAEHEYELYRADRETERIVEQEAPACMDALRTQPPVQARIVCERIGDPKDARRLTLLGQLYAGAGGFADALDPLQRAAKLEPESFEAWHYLGMSLYGLRRYAEALIPLRKAEQLNPQYFDTVNLLAKALYALGDYKGALPVLERAHNLNPDDTQLTSVLEQLRVSLRGRK
jgi:tetratricopeptide (TPR) repeat protein